MSLILWDYFEVMTSKVQVIFLHKTELDFCLLSSSPTQKFPSGWDPWVPLIGINQDLSIAHQSLIRFLFRVGSVACLPDFSSGWDLRSMKVVSFVFRFSALLKTFLFNCFLNLSMPQVLEQSLFLFSPFFAGMVCAVHLWVCKRKGTRPDHGDQISMQSKCMKVP